MLPRSRGWPPGADTGAERKSPVKTGAKSRMKELHRNWSSDPREEPRHTFISHRACGHAVIFDPQSSSLVGVREAADPPFHAPF